MRDVLLTAMSATRIEDETIAALAAWQAESNETLSAYDDVARQSEEARARVAILDG